MGKAIWEKGKGRQNDHKHELCLPNSKAKVTWAESLIENMVGVKLEYLAEPISYTVL